MGKEGLMADKNNLGDMQDNFEHITELLDSVRAQNVMNANDFNKTLSNINLKLDNISNEDNSELIKIFLAELKKSLEDRHNYVSGKFTEIEDQFKSLTEKTEASLKPAEVKELFDIIATNLNVFSKEVVSQKDLLSDITLRIDDLKNDETQKKDILKNISLLKGDLEKFNHGFESVVVNIKETLGAVPEALEKLDDTEKFADLKKDIENVFMSTNIVLSTMQVIDHKNRELEKIIVTMVSKEDFELERSQVATLITQNSQIIEYIKNLTDKSGTENKSLSEKIDTAVGIINALKNVLNDTSNQNQQMLIAQLEKLEATVSTIITEESFEKFRVELVHVVEEGTQSSNLVRAELLDTNSGMKDFLTTINSLDLKTNLQNFIGMVKNTEENVKSSIIELSNKFITTATDNKEVITTEIKENIKDISKQLDSVESGIVSASKTNLTNILEKIQAVVGDILSLKNQFQIDKMENAETIEEKIQTIREDLAASKEAVVKNSKENLENIILNIGSLFQRIELTKGDLSEKSQENLSTILETFEKLSQEISSLKEDLTLNSQTNLENITTNFEELANKIDWMKDGLNHNSQANLDSLEKMNSIIEGISKEVKLTKEEMKEQNQSFSENMISDVESLSEKISVIDAGLKESNLLQGESLKSNFEDFSQKIEEIKNELNSNLAENILNIQSSISTLPETIKENQNPFEDEKRTLIEQNSKNIEDLSTKVQNLIKGVLSKEESFKKEFQDEKTILENLLTGVQEGLSKDTVKIGEDIIANLQNIETIISQAGDGYDVSLHNLQTKLIEYLELIQSSSQQGEIKLENSLKEIIDTKVEVLSILEKVSGLNFDSNFSLLTAEINEKFQGILLNITELEGISTSKNRDNLQKTLNTIEERFEKVLAAVESYKNGAEDVVKDFTDEILEQINGLKAQVSLTNTDVMDTFNSKTEEIVNGFAPVKETLEQIAQINFDKIIDDVKSQIDLSLINLTSSLNTSSKDEKAEIIEKISDNFAALTNKLDDLKDDLISKDPDGFEVLESMVKDILEQVSEKKDTNESFDEILDANKEEIFSKIEGVAKDLIKTQTDLKSSISDGFDENSSLMKDNLDELTSVKTELLEEIAAIKKSFEKEESFNADDFKAIAQNMAEQIEDKISISEESYKTSTNSLLSEIKTSFNDKVEDGLDDLKSFIEVIENNKDLSSAVDALKSELLDKFSILSDEIEESVLSVNFKEDFDTINKDIENSISYLLENFYDKILLAIENDKSTQETLTKTEEIIRRVEDLKRNINEDISEKLDNFSLSIDKQAEDFSNLISEIRVSLTELKETYVDLSLNSSMEISSLLSNIQEKIDTVTEKLEGYSFENIIKASQNQLSDEINAVKDRLENLDLDSSISEGFNLVNQKIDTLLLTSENDLGEALGEDLAEIKGTLLEQNKLMKGLKALEQLEKLPNTDDLAEIKEDIKKSLDKFSTKLDDFNPSTNIGEGFDFDETELKNLIGKKSDEVKSELKNEIIALKKESTENILNIFEQISFVVEAEEIKDFVEEKSEDLKLLIENLSKNLSKTEKKYHEGTTNLDGGDIAGLVEGQTEDILSSLDILHEKSRNVDNNFSDIRSGINEIKKRLQMLQNGTGGLGEEFAGYSYTLQDIESDIAKVRIILNELAQSKEQVNSGQPDNFNKLNEDIMSLSSRTNKLLLNSDESYSILKENLDEFKNIVYQLDEKIKCSDNTEHNKKIEQKLEKVNNLVLSNVQSDKLFNQAFTYLAEWVDSASKEMNEITKKVSDIDGVKLSIAEIKKSVPKKADTEMILDEITKKFEQQQKRILSLEAKIEQLSKKTGKGDVNVASVVEEVLAQVGVIDKKEGTKTAKKIDNIEKQLTKLGKSIEKITSYVD